MSRSIARNTGRSESKVVFAALVLVGGACALFPAPAEAQLEEPECRECWAFENPDPEPGEGEWAINFGGICEGEGGGSQETQLVATGRTGVTSLSADGCVPCLGDACDGGWAWADEDLCDLECDGSETEIADDLWKAIRMENFHAAFRMAAASSGVVWNASRRSLQVLGCHGAVTLSVAIPEVVTVSIQEFIQ